MNDDRYRWQDHVPASVNWKAYLVFGVVFAALLAFAGAERAETAETLHRDALLSIKATKMARAPADPFQGLFVRHSAATLEACRPGHVRPTIYFVKI